MTSAPPDDFQWPARWEPIASEAFGPAYPCFSFSEPGEGPPPATISEELQREVCPGHPLYRVACRAVARCQNFNEFLLLTANPEMPLALVHLTWRREHRPTFPWFRGYKSGEEFKRAWPDTSSA